jgi:hypothetical protein
LATSSSLVAAKPRATNSSSPAAMIASRRSAARNARLEGGLGVDDGTAAALGAGGIGAAFSRRCRPLACGAEGFFGDLGSLDMGIL